jgi:predicted permease
MAPLLGRTFAENEERFGGSRAAVIGEGLWTRRYGRAPGVLGQRLVLGGIGYTVVGVMPAAFTSASIDVWLPAQTPPDLMRVREARFAHAFATAPRMNELALDLRGLAFSAAASGVAAVVFGLWPTLHATRGELTPALAQAGRGASAARHRMQRLLVMSQIALSVVLAASAGLTLRSYNNLTHVDFGFNAEHAITFHVAAAWDEDRARVGQLQERLVAELEQLPDVVAAGITNFLPATGATLRYQVILEGFATSEDNGKVTVGERTVNGGYLRAMGASLIAGDWCPPLRYDFKALPKAMVNRAFAARYSLDLVGRHVTFDQFGGPHEIVGIVGDLVEDGPRAAPAPYVYACESAGSWPDPEYVVRTHGDPRGVMSAVREIVHRIDPNRAIFGVKMVDTVIAGALDQPRLNAGLLIVFAAAAIALASLGLYSLLMLLVSERTREMGVRMALGAAPVHVVGLVFAGAGRLLAGGITVGLALTLGTARVLRAALFSYLPA